ncbi:IclR family transcriptional regulator [Plantactinospora sp. S1510]|uniref:IclR family transcriptional regulator n=1 Tax=Plantactinospora alkalitolerans TaxID=2789879 RepID=A0ABS0GNG7_9ACTN|nr:IclR family transcriptional regulator [Plantactinospora alkalitolerans]MBF9127604.1 IclR family transcriptional regulator [Plantactinospora alkalitolerans]
MKNEAPVPPYHIASVDHALRLLLLLQTKPSIRVAEAANELKVARSTAHRLLAMLVYRGFAAQNATTRAYHPGPVLIEVGMGALSKLDVRRKARPYLERLVATTGETASLQILEGNHVRFVDSVESTNAVRVASRAGVSLPAHASSGGKVLLAGMSLEAVQRLYPSEPVEQVTDPTRTDPASLFEELAETRAQGYSVNHCEGEPGLVAVGVPLPDRTGTPIASLTVAGPTARMGPDEVDRAVEALREAAQELGESLYR